MAEQVWKGRNGRENEDGRKRRRKMERLTRREEARLVLGAGPYLVQPYEMEWRRLGEGDRHRKGEMADGEEMVVGREEKRREGREREREKRRREGDRVRRERERGTGWFKRKKGGS
jgi:hypothetical protein